MHLLDICDLAAPLPLRKQLFSPTGILGLDLLLGGGWLRGRISEISGKEQSGKSTLALYALAQAQRNNRTAVIVTGRGDEVQDWRLNLCHIDLADILVAEATEYDEAIEAACSLLKTHDVDVLVIDDLHRSQVTKGRARLTKPRMGLLAAATQQSGTTTLLVVDTSMHWLDASPFWIGQHINTKYRGNNLLDVHAVRTPTGYVGKTLSIPVRDGGGVDDALHVLRLATRLGIVEDRHGYYTYRGDKLGHGAAATALQLSLRSDPILLDIDTEIRRLGAEALFEHA